MSTSLAEQLRKLTVPQTSILGRTDKKRPSLLFDPKEAASINAETFYQIGLEGLEELKTKNPVFAKFENSLFHVTSKHFERSVQTEDANRQLNKRIKRFLVLLSPYFMLNCTYKALEWLIYQYSIHEYTKEDILMLILPYHETNIFVRMLQLLDLKDSNDRWNWLMPLQKPGIHLPKATLYNHAASNGYFIKFISNFIDSLVKEHENHNFLSVLFNFYCATLTGALEYSNVVKETHVTNMLPGLLAGLNSEIADYCAAVYVIAAKLFTKTTLNAKILSKLVEKITKFPIKALHTEGTMLLVILYQTQSHFRDISGASLLKLSKEAVWLPKKIEELRKKGVFVAPMLEVVLGESIKEAISNNDESLQDFVVNLIQSVHYDEDFVGKIIRMFLYAYRSKGEHLQAVEKWSKQVFHKLEVQYPSAFDQEVMNIMKIPANGKFTKDQKSMRKLIQNSMRVRGTSIFEKLYHPSAQIRLEAVKYLLKHFSELNNRENDLLKNIIIQNLNNDQPDIVLETLKDSRKFLPKLLKKTELNRELYKILNKHRTTGETWSEVMGPVLQILCNNYVGDEATLLLQLFPFLLPSTPEELKLSKIILNSPCTESSKLLKFLYGYSDILNSANDFCAHVFKGLKLSDIMPDIRELLQAFKQVPEELNNTLHKYVAALLLSSTLPEKCPAEVTCLFLDILISYLKTTNLKPCKAKATVVHCIQQARNDKFPLEGFLKCVTKLILKTKPPETSLEKMDLSTEPEINKFFVTLTNMLLDGCFNSKKTVTELYFRSLDAFLKHFIRNYDQNTISALLNAATTNSKYNKANFQINCLQAVSKYLDGNKTALIKLDNLTVPYLLVLLGNPDTNIRNKALEILDELCSNTTEGDTYLELIEQIIEYKEEISLDQEQISVVMSNIYKESNIFKQLLVILQEEFPICLKVGLLNVLSKINTMNIFEITAQLGCTVLEAYKSSSRDLTTEQSQIIYYNCLRFTEGIGGDVKLESNIWNFLENCVKNENSLMTVDNTKKCPACFALEPIDIDLFSSLKLDVQNALLMLIVDIATFSQNPDVIAAANHVVKRIDLDAELISASLKKMCDVKSVKTLNTPRKRVSTIPTVDILDMEDWKKGVAVLEIIQNKKKIRNIHVILPILFEILKKCLDFEEQTNVEYPKQLVLSSILHCCTKLEEGQISENVFNMELVVQCIRASQNPQVHHHALVLLAHAATIIPKQVLHHIMAIFTFMGSSVLRHDDAYSFQIITKIIDTIIPILVEDASEENVSNVLRVFVDVILDVPEHRRMPIYTQLLNKIDQKENLYLFLLLMFEAHVLHPQPQNTKKNLQDIVPKRLDVAANLCRTFKPPIVIQTCIKLIQYLRNLPEDKDDPATTSKIAIFDIKRRTPKQFRHFKFVLLNFIGNLLTSVEFVNQVAELNESETYEMEPLYKETIINTLTYIQTTSKVAEKNSNTNQAQYWKVLLHHSYDILDSLNALLTPQMFLLVIRGLMVHNLTAIKKRAMELLNNRLQHNTTFFDECEDNELYAMLPPLIQIIKLTEDEEAESENELIIQTALLSLKLLVRLLAPKNPEKFVDILDFITCLLKSTEGNILASVILCLADFCYNLRSHSIKNLGPFMNALLKVVKRQKLNELPNLLLLSAVAAINKILDCLPLFLSPYLEKLLCEISSLTARIDLSSTDTKIQPIITKISNIKHKLGTLIPLRVLIPNVDLAYVSLASKKDYKGIGPLMDVLTENLSGLSSSEIQGFLPDLTAFFLKALDFRSEYGSTEDDVETHIIGALTALVLKLSESSFRPLYYKLFHWATSGHGPKERVVTFYCLSNSMANCLKGLFVLFAQHILQNAATLLGALNTIEKGDLGYSEEESLKLLENILGTLSAVFLYDSQRFVNKERFDLLMQPLVDQLENNLGGNELFENRTKTLVIPCLVNFAVATADDALWKQLNYQILLKMRHDSSLIRLLALECLTQIVKKLGDDFLPLLPETIPFLAELLEDSNEKVEKACQKSVQELEKVLGEPLQKYF